MSAVNVSSEIKDATSTPLNTEAEIAPAIMEAARQLFPILQETLIEVPGVQWDDKLTCAYLNSLSGFESTDPVISSLAMHIRETIGHYPHREYSAIFSVTKQFLKAWMVASALMEWVIVSILMECRAASRK